MLYVIALPLLIYLSWKQKYRYSIPARFFLFKNKPFDKKDGIWFHVCSLGESKALEPLLKQLDNDEIKISTITQTGYTQASKYGVEVRYLPYEIFLPFWIKKEKLLVVLEAEFWYMLFIVAFSKGTKIILLNARISDKSVEKYMKMGWFYRKFLDRVDTVYAQSEKDKNRFLALGAKNVQVVGNIKLACEIKLTKQYQKPLNEVIVAGSTHEGEEEAILKAFVAYKKTKQTTLVIVPRHPERFENVFFTYATIW